jgi:hypothetical protein
LTPDYADNANMPINIRRPDGLPFQLSNAYTTTTYIFRQHFYAHYSLTATRRTTRADEIEMPTHLLLIVTPRARALLIPSFINIAFIYLCATRKLPLVTLIPLVI